MKARTRMAPSPTGEYHIGHIRTVLYNYALARKTGGQFIIRIEDTDRERFVEGATDRLLDVISDYGLSWDEGPQVGGPYEPYFQSQRLPLYKKHALELVENGNAYYCFCSKERLDEIRTKLQADGKVPRYDRHCRGLSSKAVDEKIKSGESFVIRLKIPDGEQITFADAVMGEITFNSSDIDDQILLKSDGFPTYHLAVVIDDHLMKITHIIRGNEWISSAPKHILIYKSFGWELPIFVHLPVFLDPGGEGKMSKRKGTVSARSFLDEGYLPEALNNYLILLGWNPGTNQEIFTLEEFVREFDINNINKSNPRFTYEKLDWFNQKYIRALDDVTLATRVSKFTDKSEAEVIKVLPLIKDRLVTLKDFDELTNYFFALPQITPADLKKIKIDHQRVLNHATSTLESTWDGKVLEDRARSFCAENNVKVGDYFMSLRVAITGRTNTPPLWDVMELLGKEETLRRLSSVLTLEI